MLRRLLEHGADTAFGREFDLRSVRSVEQFQARVGTFDYDSFKPYIERMKAGERDVTARGRVHLFARSSGTTSDRSKYIPVTRESIYRNHTLGMRDVATLFAANHPDTHIFEGKTLTLGGSCCEENGYVAGDLSAVLIRAMKFWSGWFRAPRTETAVIPDFHEKAEAICRECTGQHITSFAGVPSWNLALMRRVLEYTGKRNLLEVWPDLVSFRAWRRGVRALPQIVRGVDSLGQDELHGDLQRFGGIFCVGRRPRAQRYVVDARLRTFFEFRDGDRIVPLEGVVCGRPYAMLITSNNGLWRYEIGDRVEFTSTNPYRIRFAGRTRQYINVFGEELIVDNADCALVEACRATGARVSEYSVAPCYMSLQHRGAHEWFVEFEQEPDSRDRFSEVLDEALRAVNSDYDAKRLTTLERQHLTVLPVGTFLRWMREHGKNKVPRLVNDRHVAEQLTKE